MKHNKHKSFCSPQMSAADTGLLQAAMSSESNQNPLPRTRGGPHMPDASRAGALESSPPPVFRGIVLKQPSDRNSTSHHVSMAARQADRLKAL